MHCVVYERALSVRKVCMGRLCSDDVTELFMDINRITIAKSFMVAAALNGDILQQVIYSMPSEWKDKGFPQKRRNGS